METTVSGVGRPSPDDVFLLQQPAAEESGVVTEEGGVSAVCLVCGGLKALGIRVLSRFICEDCEAEIVRTDVGDEKYAYFVCRMRLLCGDESGGTGAV